jgi:ATP-dependent Clp protease ATP-binding subunit ClpC
VREGRRIVMARQVAVYPFERFSEDAKHVLTLAQEEAERSHHSYIGTEHILLGLVRQDGLGGRTLKALGLDHAGLSEAVNTILGGSERIIVQQIIPTSRVKKVIEMAFDEARRQGSSYVGTNHLLLAIVSEGEGVAAHVLVEKGATVDRIRTEVERLRAAGASERAGEPPAASPRKRRHFEVSDTRGRVIEVDLAFPNECSNEEVEATTSLIKAVFPGSASTN